MEDIAEVIDPHPSHRAPPVVAGGVPFVGIGDFTPDGLPDFSNARKVGPEVLDEHRQRYSLERGLVALGRVASIGKVVVLPTDSEPFALSPTMAVLQANPTVVHPQFLPLLLQGPSAQSELAARSRGSTRKSVGMKEIRKLSLVVPPLRVQRRIVDLMTHLDAHIANLRREHEALEHLRKSAREHLLGQADSWTRRPLGDVTLKIGSGATPRGGEAAYHEEGIALIRSQNVYDYRFDWNGLAFIDETQAANLNNVTVEPNDVLLNITGASVNRCCLVPDAALPARVNQHVAIIRCDTGLLDPEFLVHILRRSDLKALLDAIAGAGTTRQALTKLEIQKFEIPFPSVTRQHELASYLDAIQETIESVDTEIDALISVRDSCLSGLVSGQFEPPKAYDALLQQVA